METDGSVLAVCVNYNGAEVLGATLESLQQSEVRPDVIVVDCGSTDGSVDALPESVQLLALGENPGYGAGLNAGVRRRLHDPSCEWFLLLNNDIELNSETLGRLLECAREEGPGIFGPLIVRHSDPERVDYAWGRVVGGHALARFYGQGEPAADGRWQHRRRVELLPGCALLVHRDVFEQIGLFDEAFFMYHEEIDFLFRCRQDGFPVVFCPQAVARHRGGWSTRGQPLLKVFWIRRNTVLFLRKHRATPSQWAWYWITLGASLVKHTALLRWGHVSASLRGVREGFRNR